MDNSDKIIKVVLVDDHAVLRSGMRYILEIEDNIHVVGEASNGLEALELCESLNPDVVLMDLMMPEMDGVKATKRIEQDVPNIKVVILTSFEDEEHVGAAIDAGAISYLTKNITAPELTAAILNAYQEIASLSPSATKALIDGRKIEKAPEMNLSHRELEVLGQLVKGLTNPEIAKNLVISRATVKRHVSNILSKMDVSTRTEAVALALSLKIEL